jgi:hypothetical protein
LDSFAIGLSSSRRSTRTVGAKRAAAQESFDPYSPGTARSRWSRFVVLSDPTGRPLDEVMIVIVSGDGPGQSFCSMATAFAQAAAANLPA